MSPHRFLIRLAVSVSVVILLALALRWSGLLPEEVNVRPGDLTTLIDRADRLVVVHQSEEKLDGRELRGQVHIRRAGTAPQGQIRISAVQS